MGAESYAECINTIRLDLLEILGKSYIIQHCVAFLKNKSKEKAFQIYVTDSLKIIAETLAHHYGGSVLNMRYADIISDEEPENRTAEDIINNLKAKMTGKK